MALDEVWLAYNIAGVWGDTHFLKPFDRCKAQLIRLTAEVKIDQLLVGIQLCETHNKEPVRITEVKIKASIGQFNGINTPFISERGINNTMNQMSVGQVTLGRVTAVIMEILVGVRGFCIQICR